MGVNLRELITKKEVALEDLRGKTLVVDSFNQLYQYLTTIRARDGAPLMDSKGRITSHLVGLFSRTANLMQKNISLAFVFDGTPPTLKHAEREKRKETKIEAEKKFKAAEKKGDIDEMRKYASRFTRITPEIVDEAKDLLAALGLPVIQAPSEGEAQIAHITKKGDAFAAVSQDFDSLLHGAPKLIRNLSVAGKRKKAGTLIYETIEPELILLKENLKHLDITQDQLVAIAMIIGTDYNPGGIKGIGPKNALKLVKKHKKINNVFEEVKWEFDFSWKEVFDLIKNMPVTDKYSLKWSQPDKDKVFKILCDEHNFSEERVAKTFSTLVKAKKQKEQKGIGDFV